MCIIKKYYLTIYSRKRILSCVSDTEELNCLPAITRYNLLKSNIRAADLLIKLFWFNLPSTEFEIMQGEADSAQWQVGVGNYSPNKEE